MNVGSVGVVITSAGWVRCVVTNFGPTLVQIVPVARRPCRSSSGRSVRMRSRVELFEQIRRDRRLDELSIRELADRHGVHRRTVRQALAAAFPPPRRVYPVRRRPAIDPWVTVIDAWLIADKDASGRRTSGDALGGDGVALRGPPPGRTRAADPRGVGPADATCGREPCYRLPGCCRFLSTRLWPRT